MKSLARLVPAVAAALALGSPLLAQNDDCTGATLVTSGTYLFDTTSATLSSPGWPCAGSGGPDLWYRYVATGANQVLISLCGSTYDTALEVFSGTCSALNPVACNDDACGLQSELTFPTVAGQTYYLRIGGYFGQTGSGTMTISASASSGNDECSGAVGVGPGTTPFNTLQATTSLPPWPCAAGGNDIWFRYAPVSTGQVDLDLCGSGYDTALQVFSGSCSSLSPVACNDDACGYQSQLSFQATAGQIYYFRIGGYSGGTGSGSLQLTGPASSGGGGGGGGLGTNFCGPAVPNSTGASGAMSASGTPVAGLNDLTLHATDLPNGQFAIFIASQDQSYMPQPGGSLGTLCLGGNIARFNSQITQTSGGQLTRQVDLTDFPEPPIFHHTVIAGEVWHFQCWYRDWVGGGAVSNFTDGLTVMFF